jgi:hypothetical protein
MKDVIKTTPAIERLERDAHVANLIENIRVRAVKINEFRSKLSEIKILEQYVKVNDKFVLLLSVEGCKDAAVYIEKEDLDSGALTLKDGYLTLARIVDAKVEMDKK